MKKSIQIILGLSVSCICLWLVLRNVEISKVAGEIRQASPGWFMSGLVILILNMMLRSLRWSVILSSLKPMSAFAVTPHLVFGFL